MFTVATIPMICWLCALLAIPRRPLPGNEVAELTYRRLVGRHHLLVALAIAVTLLASGTALCALFVRATTP